MDQHSTHSLSNYHTKWQLSTQTETSQYSPRLCVRVVDACKQRITHNTFPLTLTIAYKCTAHERLFSWMLKVLSGHTQGDRMHRSVRYELISVKMTRLVDSQCLKSIEQHLQSRYSLHTIP